MAVVNYDWDEIEDNIYEEHDDLGNTIAEYTTEPGQFGHVISENRDDSSHHFHFDGIGSTTEVTDDAATIVGIRRYTSFGDVTESSGISSFSFQFIGQYGYYFDVETSEIYVRRRTYGPIVGRWISIDPIGVKKEINGYRYSFNNPHRYFDPSGLDCKDHGVWKEELCKACPPCTCDEVHGTSPLSRNFPIGDIGHEIAKKLGIDIACSVVFKVGNCGFSKPNAGRTCAKGTLKHKREIFICIQEDTPRCTIHELLVHELIHARQLCNQASGSDELEGKCEDNEKPAYEASCERRLKHRCLFPKEPGYGDAFKSCVEKGIEFSCRTAPGTVTKTCEQVIDDVFGVR